jgi:hypothetical protein
MHQLQKLRQPRLESSNSTRLLGTASFQLRDADIFGVGEDPGIKILLSGMSSSNQGFDATTF